MDLLSKRITSIRNGQKASRRQVVCRLSDSVDTTGARLEGFNRLRSSLELLRREGFIRAFSFFLVKQTKESKIKTRSTRKVVSKGINSGNEAIQKEADEITYALYLTIHLKYDTVGNSAIRSIFRTSIPARRAYISSRSFWQPQTSSGIYVFSTSQGVLTDIEARRRNLGGELLFGVV